MSKIISEYNGFELEHRPGIGYRVWSYCEDEVDIIVEEEYADNSNPDPNNLKYNVFVQVSAVDILQPTKAQNLAQSIVDAQEAADLFSDVLNK